MNPDDGPALLEREPALRQLRGLMATAGAQGGRAVLLTGEAGIGKTSLLRRLAATLDRRQRCLWGACDDLFSARPLGPLRDIAPQLGPDLPRLIEGGAAAPSIFGALYEQLDRRSDTTLLVFEDLHWADEATLDLIRYLGRRLASLSTVLVLSYRDDELGAEHPLRQVLGDLPAQIVVRLALPPLSPEGVAGLAQRAGRPAAGLHQATGGNPFYVTEVLGCGLTEVERGVPTSVRAAVRSRLARLKPGEREVLDRLSVIPGEVPLWLVRAWFAPSLREAVDACVTRGLLLCREASLAFRHELARRATEDGLSPLRRADLHAQVLALLLAPPPDCRATLSGCLHHAAQAGDAARVLALAPLAAREAAAVGAHREAAKQLDAALQFAHSATPEQLAGLYESWSYEAGLSLIDARVIEARHKAIQLWQTLGRIDKVGHNLRWLSRLSWYQGDSAGAERYAEQAVRAMESLPPCAERAWAYATRAQLQMLQDHTDAAIDWGLRAIALAEQLGEAEILCHALNSVGTAELFAGRPGGQARLEHSLRIALQQGFHEQAARVYSNVSEHAVVFKDFARAEGLLREGIAFDRRHDLDAWTHYLEGWLAQMRMEQGRLAEAQALAQAVLGIPRLTAVMRLPALTVLARVRMRTAAGDALALMQEALAIAEGTGEAQRIVPVLLIFVEQAWLQGDLPACRRHLARLDAPSLAEANGWITGEVAAWRRRVEAGPALASPCGAPPWDLELQGQAPAAAEAWLALGAPIEAALALLQAAIEQPIARADRAEQAGAALSQALRLFEAADMPAGRARAQALVRELGLRHRLPRPARGPYAHARQHPFRLTAREQQMLALMAQGLRNADIGHRLGLALRTVEHHVSAVLAKLEVGSRAEAVGLAQREGLLRPPSLAGQTAPVGPEN